MESRARILADNAEDVAAARAAGQTAAFVDRLTLTEPRIDGHGPRGAADRRSPRPGGGRDRHVAPAQRPAGRAHAGPLGSDRDHLRVPAQRDRGRRGAVPQVGERRAAARRVGGAPHEPRHRRRPGGRGGLGGPAAGGPRRGAVGGPGGGQGDALAPRSHRPDHPARRRGAHPGGPGRVPDSGDRPRQGVVPHLRGRVGGPRHGRRDRLQRQGGAPRRLQRHGDAAGPRGGRAGVSSRPRRPLARGGRGGAGVPPDAEPGPGGGAGHRGGLGYGVPGAHAVHPGGGLVRGGGGPHRSPRVRAWPRRS